jgi:hypothetical protein
MSEQTIIDGAIFNLAAQIIESSLRVARTKPPDARVVRYLVSSHSSRDWLGGSIGCRRTLHIVFQ